MPKRIVDGVRLYDSNESHAHEMWRRICRNKLAVFGMVWMAIVVICAIFADVIAPYGFDDQNVSVMLTPPCWEYPLGTDNLGRDILSRLIYGSRVSLSIGIIVTAISIIISIIIGMVAGYYGSHTDNIIMRIIDVLLSVPPVLLAIAIAAALGGGYFSLIIAMSVSMTAGNARTVRGQVMTQTDKEYIEAAKACNAGSVRIMWQYILPNISSIIVVAITMYLAVAIMTASTLSFIGLGVQAPTPEWGALLANARQYMRYNPYMVLSPGIIISLTVFSLNMIGDALRDALDPRMRGR